MNVESIGSVLNNPSTDLTRAGIQQEDFLKVLLAQLSFQDPLKPMDNQEFMSQLAQFSAIEQARQSSEDIQSMLTLQVADQAVGLLGRTVEVQSQNGSQVGEVTTVSFYQGKPVLTVQAQDGSFLTDVGLSQISIVR
jgi:flagellar basal-body rod modification protein FlgD